MVYSKVMQWVVQKESWMEACLVGWRDNWMAAWKEQWKEGSSAGRWDYG